MAWRSGDEHVTGLGLATIVTLYLTPVVWLVLSRFSTDRASKAERLGREIGAIGKLDRAAE